MSKYNMINVLMGRTADYNDKLKVGRSLKFIGRMSDEKFDELVRSLRLVDYVMDVYRMTGSDNYVRIIVKDVK